MTRAELNAAMEEMEERHHKRHQQDEVLLQKKEAQKQLIIDRKAQKVKSGTSALFD